MSWQPYSKGQCLSDIVPRSEGVAVTANTLDAGSPLSGGWGHVAQKTLRSTPTSRHENAAKRGFAAVCWRQLNDGATRLLLFACLRCRSHPDRRVAAGYRVEAAFSGVRRRVFGATWPHPPGGAEFPRGMA